MAVREDGMVASDGRLVARRTVASYGAYPEAEPAVHFLCDRNFPVERASIVGTQLQPVAGGVHRLEAALRGAPAGALSGALFGWLFGVFDWVDPVIASFPLAAYGAMLGAVLGGLLGALLHFAVGRRRDSSSVDGMRADRYELQVDEPLADEACRLLDELGAAAPAVGFPGGMRGRG